MGNYFKWKTDYETGDSTVDDILNEDLRFANFVATLEG